MKTTILIKLKKRTSVPIIISTCFLVLFVFSHPAARSQVAINTTGSLPNPSAGLDVCFPDKGLLIPRVSLLNAMDSVTVHSPVLSLLVYNTNTGGSGIVSVSPGFYYWNGILWTRIQTGDPAKWSLSGNSGTDPSTNFLGTTDSKDFIIKSNATERMRFLGTGEDRIGGTANYSKFENDGTLEFNGTATVWNEVVIPGISGKPGTVAPDFLKFRDNGSGSTGIWQYQYQHKDGIEESIFFTIQMPHDLKEGSIIEPHVHWAATTAGSGNVSWGIEFTWIDNGGVFGSTSFATATMAVGLQSKSIMTPLGGISPSESQKHIYSILCVRLFRNISSGTDTYPDRVALLSFDVSYESNTVGSRTEWTK